MMEDVVKIAKEVTFREDEEEAVREVLIGYLEKRIADCKDKLARFESKYGMTLQDFEKKLGEELPLTWEHERDYIDWDCTLGELEYLMEKLEALKKHGAR